MSDDYDIQRTSHEVIENKLLVHISKPGNVAILANRQELEDFRFALEVIQCHDWNPERKARCRELAQGIRQLLAAAFPPQN
jgi:hypothetical protein